MTTNGSLGIREFQRVTDALRSMCCEDANIVPGTAIDESLPDDVLEVTIVVAGFESVGQAAAPKPTLVHPKPVVESSESAEPESGSPSAEASEPKAEAAAEETREESEEVLQQTVLASEYRT